MFLMGMMLVMKQWDNFGILLLLFLLLSIALYFVWFRHLDKGVK
jgi:solute:Na+ symporter, SSS family